MLLMRFHPECDLPALASAAAEYQALWKEHGERIVAQFASITGLQFAEQFINAIVFDGRSDSYPFRLRASYDTETKLGTLIHELAHRLMRGNWGRLGLPSYTPDQELENHELIDLFLFDVWQDLYGEAFARRRVDHESLWRPLYRQAWQASLSLDRRARAEKFASLRHSTATP